MRAKKINKSGLIPKYRSPIRTKLVELLTEFPDYVKNLEKGYHFFTQEELRNLKDRYPDGLTWEDIDQELSRKGIMLKKSTFRKYVQEGNLPRAIRYRNRENGRVAIFPPDTISHINFILYFYKVVDRAIFDQLIELYNKISSTSTHYELVDSKLVDYPNVEAAINHFVISDGGDRDIYNAIEEALAPVPDEQRRRLADLDELRRSYHDRREKFVSRLKKGAIFDLEIIADDSANQPGDG
jgi:hypothetical protein